MANRRAILCATFGLVMVLAVVGALFIRPNYVQAAAIRVQIAELKNRITTLDSRTAAVEKLAAEVAVARRRVENDLKIIPETPDIAGLIRSLSFPHDQQSVIDQTFTAGSPSNAIIGGKATAQAMPLTAEMKATFDSIIALLQATEAMDRLVRVSSVRISCNRNDQTNQPSPILEASIGLEAIYDPPSFETTPEAP